MLQSSYSRASLARKQHDVSNMPKKLVRSTSSKSINRPKIVFLETKFSVPWRLLLFTAVLLTLSQRLKSVAEITCLGDPKYLTRLDRLINSTETAEHAQSLRMEHEGLSSPKEPGRKSTSSSEEVRTIVHISSVVYWPWVKVKKVNICKLKTSLRRNFVYS